MNRMRIRWEWLVGIAWASLPWLFWAVYQFHKPDHADPFWLPAMPVVFISIIPLLLAYGGDTPHDNWFPVGGIFACSLFNLVTGLLISFIIRSLGTKPRG